MQTYLDAEATAMANANFKLLERGHIDNIITKNPKDGKPGRAPRVRNPADYSLPSVLDMNTTLIGANRSIDPRAMPLSNDAVLLSQQGAGVARVRAGNSVGSATTVPTTVAASFSNAGISSTAGASVASPAAFAPPTGPAHVVPSVTPNDAAAPTLLADTERGVTIGVQTSFYKYDSGKAKELD